LISTHIAGKTAMCCKNRFAKLKRKIKNGNYIINIFKLLKTYCNLILLILIGKLPELSIPTQAHPGLFLDPLANPNLQTSHLHNIALLANANSVRRISSSNIAIENFSNIVRIYLFKL
jgi:hypothetical protein